MKIMLLLFLFWFRYRYYGEKSFFKSGITLWIKVGCLFTNIQGMA